MKEMKKAEGKSSVCAEETDDPFFCKIHNKMFVHQNEKLYCKICDKYYNYIGPAKILTRHANSPRDIKIPKLETEQIKSFRKIRIPKKTEENN